VGAPAGSSSRNRTRRPESHGAAVLGGRLVAVGSGDEAVEDSVGVRIEAGDLARVGDARDLGDLDAVVESLAGVIQEGVLLGLDVVEEAVLTGGGVAVVTDGDALVVDPQDLGENERGTGFPGDG